jgi:molybdenum cofactor cytidylyltransferase
MAPASRARVTGLVLAAGGSTRLGQPKQLLPYGDAPLLEHVLNVARRCPFDQLLCVIGGSGTEVREQVHMHDVEVIENPSYGAGCSSSIAAALGAVDPRCEVLVLMLGDQPGVAPEAVSSLIASRGAAPLAACSYDDGRGHPLAFARSMFAELADLHGDKAVWKLMDGRHEEVVDVPVPGLVPPDIDTWEDYQRAVAGHV